MFSQVSRSQHSFDASKSEAKASCDKRRQALRVTYSAAGAGLLSCKVKETSVWSESMLPTRKSWILGVDEVENVASCVSRFVDMLNAVKRQQQLCQAYDMWIA